VQDRGPCCRGITVVQTTDRLTERPALHIRSACPVEQSDVEEPGPPVAGEEPQILQFRQPRLDPDLIPPTPCLHQPPGPLERKGHFRPGQQVLRLDIDDHGTVIGDQEVIRDVLADLSADLRLQQEGLGQDAMHRPVEVREDQP
jgi:hypothetical protein